MIHRQQNVYKIKGFCCILTSRHGNMCWQKRCTAGSNGALLHQSTPSYTSSQVLLTSLVSTTTYQHLVFVRLKPNSHTPFCSHVVPTPFPCHAVLLRVLIVFFPFDLHSAAMFDSNMPCQDRVVLKATSQSHGTARHVWINSGHPQTVYRRPARVQLLVTITQSSTKDVIRSIPIR
jgi:hypothetical protein